ncbi:BadM/Rrf2 family transcriptional regulator [Albidovulum inexpectatum]|uniref:BadM/Rrf2 family transcriptional regulator n=1 Tax=Albidovulum inexpectatum TaxID=196587 RepID=A0A2S5JF83_9RHOB|nr:Rrf2 family transcriptional regulator [Albidovulum inexpectatum]PPB79965.1 BadM/Rrf2 family transcriptional regulator [Albidovulum inexpectatum]
MRLTSFTDYGLRMLMRLASAPCHAFTTAELATEFALSRNHLAKIAQRLAQAGIIETRRGGKGGACLALPPEQIRLGHVVRILEEGSALVECLGPSGTCTIDGSCRLKTRLKAAQRAFLDELDRATLADIALPPCPVDPA